MPSFHVSLQFQTIPLSLTGGIIKRIHIQIKRPQALGSTWVIWRLGGGSRKRWWSFAERRLKRTGILSTWRVKAADGRLQPQGVVLRWRIVNLKLLKVRVKRLSVYVLRKCNMRRLHLARLVFERKLVAFEAVRRRVWWNIQNLRHAVSETVWRGESVWLEILILIKPSWSMTTLGRVLSAQNKGSSDPTTDRADGRLSRKCIIARSICSFAAQFV